MTQLLIDTGDNTGWESPTGAASSKNKARHSVPVKHRPAATMPGEVETASAGTESVATLSAAAGVPQEEVTVLEKWEGTVTEILEDGFRASFRRNHSDFQELVAEFALDELESDDQKILAEGMSLIWLITRERRNGGLRRCSALTLRRQLRQPLSEQNRVLKEFHDWLQPEGAASTCG